MSVSAGACLPLLPADQPSPFTLQGVSGAGKTTLMDVLAGRKRQGEQPLPAQATASRAELIMLAPLLCRPWHSGLAARHPTVQALLTMPCKAQLTDKGSNPATPIA